MNIFHRNVKESAEVRRFLEAKHWDQKILDTYPAVKMLSANVYVGKSKDHGLVAVKEYEFGGPDGLPSYDRFEHEVEIHSKINHPNIPRFVASHDQGKGRGKGQYIITQFLEGESVARRFFLKPTSQADALKILIQITEAAAYLHQLGIIHRDITPENIILSGNRASLIDFGAATEFSPLNPPLLYPMTVCINEKVFLRHNWPRPPEIDMRSYPSTDVFYICAAALFMLTGHMLASDDLNYPLDYLPRVNPTVSDNFLEVLEKALAEKVDLRFHDGSELLKTLQGIPV